MFKLAYDYDGSHIISCHITWKLELFRQLNEIVNDYANDQWHDVIHTSDHNGATHVMLKHVSLY